MQNLIANKLSRWEINLNLFDFRFHIFQEIINTTSIYMPYKIQKCFEIISPKW